MEKAIESDPIVLKASTIAEIWVSESAAYKLMREKGFPLWLS
ncbi:hypothetical protein [Bacillus sp. NPDC093026]